MAEPLDDKSKGKNKARTESFPHPRLSDPTMAIGSLSLPPPTLAPPSPPHSPESRITHGGPSSEQQGSPTLASSSTTAGTSAMATHAAAADTPYHELTSSEPPASDPDALTAHLRGQLATATTLVAFLHTQVDALRAENEARKEQTQDRAAVARHALAVLRQAYARGERLLAHCGALERRVREAKNRKSGGGGGGWRKLLGMGTGGRKSAAKEKGPEREPVLADALPGAGIACARCGELVPAGEGHRVPLRWPDGGLNPFAMHPDFLDTRHVERQALVVAAAEHGTAGSSGSGGADADADVAAAELGRFVRGRELRQVVELVDDGLRKLGEGIADVAENTKVRTRSQASQTVDARDRHGLDRSIALQNP
ncbi:uncharacterized protein K452DRAFT_315042 [Aplosporella prunicola CBS 121167]|uniref:Uncharacterized protein n=1 Tax=Aplosporella prunicola CBS 121167 TaxID=1176127 RepID=A0A6A6BVF1_9PEZI|nr:uncharacterized protein K452DRAFT_315042 [Aplosporella prunicola CBS 121167]KAF2146827.1 hypothetical protein K452DRAFT_315042 [Aplosporella prunicola CBS 121167]